MYAIRSYYVPDGLPAVHPVPDHRPGGGQRADVDGHDDDVAGDGLPALQADALRASRWMAPDARLIV